MLARREQKKLAPNRRRKLSVPGFNVVVALPMRDFRD
jgi:hypothetical protein